MENKEVIIKYKINRFEYKIKIFGSTFVKNNRDNCKIKVFDQIKNLSEYLYLDDYENLFSLENNDNYDNYDNLNDFEEYESYDNFYDYEKYEEEIEIKLIILKDMKDISKMFKNCTTLLSINNLEILNTSEVNNMNHIFQGCINLKSISNIS